MHNKVIFVFIVLLFSVSKAQYKIELWNQIEITFQSSICYENPFLDVDFFATFTSEKGDVISRPAFWDGGNVWKIRFAPTTIGKWNFKLSGKMLNYFKGAKNGYIEAVEYKGNLPIYKNGFLKISQNKRYFTYNNDKPFFYLADTHWFLPLEKWYECNTPDCKSQFKFMVDKRAKQGFTVYQVQTNGIKLVEDSAASIDIKAFRDIDRKFNYLIEKGFVINTSIGSAHNFALVLGKKGAEMLAKYWVARYGAYPLIWMTAQEVDLDKHKYLEIWKAAAQTIHKYDDYRHPHSAHLWDNSNPTLFNSDNWHNFHMIQAGHIIWGGGTQTKDFYEKYYMNNPIKPMLESEANYENLGKDKICTATDIRNAAYKSILCGSFGFGYGVQGIWQNCYTETECGCCMDWGIMTWFEGLNAEGGEQMYYLKNLFNSHEWYKLVPRFNSPEWIEIKSDSEKEREMIVLASISRQQFFLYDYSTNNIKVTLKNLDKKLLYKAKWYDPQKGIYININESPAVGSSSWIIPPKPSAHDYLLILDSGKNINEL